MLNKPQLPFWIFTASIFIILICPTLFQDGMFMDGIQYACVAKNLANGDGSFWHPFLSETWWKAGSNYFMEHPPLIYGIQAQFFKLLGNSLYTERIYSLITGLLTAIMIVKNWRIIPVENSIKNTGWLPLLLWIITPVCYWSYQNNLQENTMSLFILISTYFTIKGLISKQKIYLFFLGGIGLFLATFSKGVPGMFPLFIIPIYYLIFKTISIKKTIIYSGILVITPIIIYSILLLNENAYQSLSFYLEKRLLFRIQEEGVVSNRFYILYQLFMELLPSIIFTIAILLISFIKKTATQWNQNKKLIIFFLLIGFSGSLPLMLTDVQRGFYLLPAIPFFSISFSLIIAPIVHQWTQKIKPLSFFYKLITWGSISLLIISILITASKVNKTGRDHDILHDVHLIGNKIPNGCNIQMNITLYEKWNLQFYLLRYYNIACTYSQNKSNYILSNKSKTTLPKLKKINLNTIQFDLYKSETNK